MSVTLVCIIYHSPVLSPQISAEGSEKTLLGWLFDGGVGYPGYSMCHPDPSHPSKNPPLVLGEHIPPPDNSP